MFDLIVSFDDIKILNIEREDVEKIYEWINFQNSSIGNRAYFDLTFEDLYERFIEYYVSECEFFSKIMVDNKILGIIKGRIEFRNPNEVWINCLFLDTKIRNEGLASSIVKEVINYFHNEYGIKNFYTRIIKENDDSLIFWENNDFNMIRVAKNFCSIEGEKKDMFVLGKHI